MSTVIIFIRPFLKRAHKALAARRRAMERVGGNRKVLETKQWVHAYLFAADVPIWIWTLHHRRFVKIPARAQSGHRFRTDAYGAGASGGLGGWAPPTNLSCCEDVSDLHGARWFSYEFNRGEIAAFQNVNPQLLVAPLEMTGQLLGLELFTDDDDENTSFGQHTDSLVSTWALTNFRCRSLPLLLVLRACAWKCLRSNFWSVVDHWSGVQNDIADKLSRPSEYPWFVQFMASIGSRLHVDADVVAQVLKLPSRSDVRSEENALRALVGISPSQ